MKKILTLILLIVSFTAYSQVTLRKGFTAVQNGDTASVVYNNGVWTLESDTTITIRLDTLYYSDDSYSITASSGGGAVDSIYDMDSQTWITDTLPKSDSSHVVSQADTFKIDNNTYVTKTIDDYLLMQGLNSNIEVGDEGISITSTAGAVTVSPNLGYNIATSSAINIGTSAASSANNYRTAGSHRLINSTDTLGFTGNTLTAEVMNPDTIMFSGGDTITGGTPAKTGIEAIDFDKLTTDTLILGGDTVNLNNTLYMYIQGASTVIPVTQNVYSKITGYTVGYNENSYYTVAGDSVLLVPGVYDIQRDLSFIGNTNDNYLSQIYLNNVASTVGGEWNRGMSGTDPGVTTSVWVGTISTNTWLSIRLTNTVDNDDPTVTSGNLRIKRIR